MGGIKVKTVAAGLRHSACIDETGNVFIFGEKKLNKLVSCGWKHTPAISDGYVFTWGCGGSHGTFSVDGHSSGGQLGHGTDVDFIEPTVIDLGSYVRALQVSCGFNHTGANFEYM